MSTEYKIDDSAARELLRMRKKLDNIRGRGVTHSRDNISIAFSDDGSKRHQNAFDLRSIGTRQGQCPMMVADNRMAWTYPFGTDK